MLLFYMGTAIMFSFKSRFFQVTGVRRWLSATVGNVFLHREKKSDGVSQFGAFCSVLAACIGTGNIVGVASAIASGGAGAVFWMWVSAFFSMMTSYAENTLGIRYRYTQDGRMCGGAFAYMKKGAQMPGLAKSYAALCLFSGLGSGNMTQSNSVSEAVFSGFGLPRVAVGLVCAVLCFVIIRGGVKRIAKVNEIIVPVMSVAFIALTSWVLYVFRHRILGCVAEIFTEAFSLKSINGFGMYKAVRFGVARGVFSNEAGLGTSTLLHAQADCTDPREQGMWGMFEVFCDTLLLCTVTALAILASGVFDNNRELFGAQLSVAAYSAAGTLGKKGIAALTAVFGFASLVGWSFYGEKSGEELFGRDISKGFHILYPIAAFVGSVTSPRAVWSLADVTSGLMALPNLFCVVLLRREVDYFKKGASCERTQSRSRLYPQRRSPKNAHCRD